METTEELRAKAQAALAAVPDVWCYECCDIDFGSMNVSESRVEVEFSAFKVLGRCPSGNKELRAEWTRKHREMHVPAIEAAKKALRAGKVKFREIDNGYGIKKLWVVPHTSKGTK